jgi:hypothetical protein
MTRRGFLIACGAALPAAAKSWDKPEFPHWTGEFVDRILTDSPWAKSLTAPHIYEPAPPRLLPSDFQQITLPKLPEARPVRTEMYLIVRWRSALPVRRALALAEFGRARLEEEPALELLTHEEPDYVIEMAGFPAILVRDAKRLEGDLARTARLFLPGRRPLAPSAVDVPAHGNHLIATIRFPRPANIEPAGAAELTAEHGPAPIKQSFKLKEMIYRGRLEL